jgi:hypothetical protein
MATFTDWMRLGKARMTPLTTLALGAAMAWIAPESADAATGERTVSGVRITLGEEGRRWTLVPTLLDGKVESFLALREDLAYGENLTAVWYRKVAAADGAESWETKAFEDQDQSKAIRAVKEALALGDSTDESWPVAVAAVAAAEPEPMVKGVLESDALAPLVADLDDPQPLVEMLEGAGWKAAWIGPLEGVALATAEPGVVACPQGVVLAALTTAAEVAATGGVGAGVASLRSSLAVCNLFCIPYVKVISEGQWGPPTCGSWGYFSCGATPPSCTYHRAVFRMRSRTVADVDWTCTQAPARVEWQTAHGLQQMTCAGVCACPHSSQPGSVNCPPQPPISGSGGDAMLSCQIPAGCEPNAGGWSGGGPWYP